MQEQAEVTLLLWMVREGLPDKVSSEQKPERSEGASHVTI